MSTPSVTTTRATTPPTTGPGATTSPPDPALDRALDGLVAEGTLTPEQAERVRRSRSVAAVPATGAPGGVAPVPDALPAVAPEAAPARPRHNPLPEILGYVGAALVGSAVVSILAQYWPDWSDAMHVALVASATVVAYGAGLALAGLSGWRPGLAAGPDGRRRLVALLMAVGAGFLGALVIVSLDAAGQVGASWVPLVSGVVCLAAAAGGAWLARGVLGTLAVAAGALWSLQGLLAWWQPNETAWWLPLPFAAVGLAWLAVAPRLLSVPVVSEALGWGFLILSQLPSALWSGPGEDALATPSDTAYFDALRTQSWVATGVLAVLAVIGMTGFLRGGRWPWAAGGVAAAVGTTLAIGGRTMDWALAMLVAGIALLVVSVGLVGLRRRRDRHLAGPASPTHQRRSPDASLPA